MSALSHTFHHFPLLAQGTTNSMVAVQLLCTSVCLCFSAHPLTSARVHAYPHMAPRHTGYERRGRAVPGRRAAALHAPSPQPGPPQRHRRCLWQRAVCQRWLHARHGPPHRPPSATHAVRERAHGQGSGPLLLAPRCVGQAASLPVAWCTVETTSRPRTKVGKALRCTISAGRRWGAVHMARWPELLCMARWPEVACVACWPEVPCKVHSVVRAPLQCTITS